MNFCVECGRECAESLDGMCIDCWLEGRDLIALPHHVDLRVCTNCGEYESGTRWVAKERLEAVEDAAAEALLVVRGAEVTAVGTLARELDPRTWEVSVQADCDIQGFQAEGEAVTTVRLKNTVCRRCSRQLGNYYEAILQLRSASGRLGDAERERSLAAVEESVARHAAADRGVFVTKTETVPGGVDVYLSSMSVARSIAREFVDSRCAETKESPKLSGQTPDGQDMYRLTVLVRLPDFAPGDVVAYRGRHCKLLRLSGSGGKVLDLEDFRERTVRRGDVPEIRLHERACDLRDATVVSSSASEVQVLDPDTYAAVDLRVPEGAETGETVKVVSVDGVLYYVPRPGSWGVPGYGRAANPILPNTENAVSRS